MLDLILAGTGLANGLLAYRLKLRRPEMRLLVLEQDEKIGGNHTWSFHKTDLTPAQGEWMTPFVAHEWANYDVAFPGFSRRIDIGYRSVTSERFRQVIAHALGGDLRVGAEVTDVQPGSVRLASGETLHARAVIDGRGYRPSPHMVQRYQKFLGQEVRLAAPHGLVRPIVMDATVPQTGGYRFIYVLPFAPDVLLIEDTTYSDEASLDHAGLQAGIAAYAEARGWRIAEVLREERGVLPVTLSGDMTAFWDAGTSGLPRSGLRAGLFHPTTGYSLPDAVRLADYLAAMPMLTAEAIHAAVRQLALRRWRRQAFFRLLNRMLFMAGPPKDRFVIMRRFHRLPTALIARFYRGELLWRDKLSLLTGRPPAPIIGALRAIVATGR